jgi:hypothetical protein
MMSLEEWRRKIAALRADPDFKLFLTSHVRLRMREREVSFVDLQHVIERGAVTEDQSEHGETKLRMRGRDVDGRSLDIVIVIDEGEVSIRVVTVIAD